MIYVYFYIRMLVDRISTHRICGCERIIFATHYACLVQMSTLWLELWLDRLEGRKMCSIHFRGSKRWGEAEAENLHEFIEYDEGNERLYGWQTAILCIENRRTEERNMDGIVELSDLGGWWIGLTRVMNASCRWQGRRSVRDDNGERGGKGGGKEKEREGEVERKWEREHEKNYTKRARINCCCSKMVESIVWPHQPNKQTIDAERARAHSFSCVFCSCLFACIHNN